MQEIRSARCTQNLFALIYPKRFISFSFWCKLESLLSPTAAAVITPFNERRTTHAMIAQAACENFNTASCINDKIEGGVKKQKPNASQPFIDI